MRKNNNKLYMIALILMLLFFAIGYAIFSNLLQITGVVNTFGSFDIQFVTADISDNQGATPTATISPDGKSLTIAVNDLVQPGSYAKVDVVVKNVGNIPAVLKTVNITGDDDEDIIVTISDTPVEQSLAVEETYNFSITVQWDINSTTGSKTLDFSVDLVYEQGI